MVKDTQQFVHESRRIMSVFDHFVGSALRGLKVKTKKTINQQETYNRDLPSNIFSRTSLGHIYQVQITTFITNFLSLKKSFRFTLCTPQSIQNYISIL